MHSYADVHRGVSEVEFSLVQFMCCEQALNLAFSLRQEVGLTCTVADHYATDLQTGVSQAAVLRSAGS